MTTSEAVRRPAVVVFVVALTVRAVAAVAIWFIWEGTIFGDEGTYSEMATAVVEGRTDVWDDFTRWLYWNTAAWTIPLTGLYALFTPHILLGQLLAAALGAATAAWTTALAGWALPRNLAMAAGLAVALFPSQVLWSALTLKDAAVWAAAVLAGLAVTSALGSQGRRRAGWAFALVLALVLMVHLRTHTFVVVTWAAAFAIVMADSVPVVKRLASASLLLTAVPWVFGLGPAGLGFVAEQFGTVENRRVANAAGAATALEGAIGDRMLPDPPSELPGDGVPPGGGDPSGRGEPGTGAGVPPVGEDPSGRRKPGIGAGVPAGGGDPSSRGKPGAGRSHGRTEPAPMSPVATADDMGDADLGYLPRGIVVMLFEPLPGTIDGNDRVRWAALEHLLWYPLLLLGVVGLWSAWSARRVLAYPVLAAAATTVMYGLAEGNFGTAYRHRGEVVWAVALLAAFGADRLWRTYRRRQEGSS